MEDSIILELLDETGNILNLQLLTVFTVVDYPYEYAICISATEKDDKLYVTHIEKDDEGNASLSIISDSTENEYISRIINQMIEIVG